MKNLNKIRIGSRGSQLALTQANIVKDNLYKLGFEAEIIVIKTTGDKILDKPLYDIGGKALFLKELEEALLKKEIDLAVHSMKDVPGELPEGLVISAILKREDPRDMFVSKYPDIASLPKGAVVGTSSVRRIAQILNINPNVKIVNMRGNVDSRIKRYLAGEFDAIVLACAGLSRLGISYPDFKPLSPEIMISAVGQGAIAIEIRKSDIALKEITSKFNHEPTWLEVQAERGFLETLQGNCRTPIGALAKLSAGTLDILYFLADDDGNNIRRAQASCPPDKGFETGKNIALKFLK